MNVPDISANTHVQIDGSIFASYRMHAMNYFASLRIFIHQGRKTQRQQITEDKTEYFLVLQKALLVRFCVVGILQRLFNLSYYVI